MQKKSKSPLKWLLVFFIAGPLLLFGMSALGVASYFWVGPEVRGLRDAALQNASGHFHRKIELNVGRCSFGLAHLIAPFIPKMPKEARQALSAAKAAQVSIYETDRRFTESVGMLRAADEGMTRRGWMRLVGVAQHDCTVAVYIPKKMSSARNARVCVLALNERQLVCVYARTDLEPLWRLAMTHVRHDFPKLALN
jgi:hypothetical protein